MLTPFGTNVSSLFSESSTIVGTAFVNSAELLGDDFALTIAVDVVACVIFGLAFDGTSFAP